MVNLTSEKKEYIIKSYLMFLLLPLIYVILGMVVSSFYSANSSMVAVGGDLGPVLYKYPYSAEFFSIIIVAITFIIQITLFKKISLLNRVVFSAASFLLMVLTFLLLGNLF